MKWFWKFPFASTESVSAKAAYFLDGEFRFQTD